DGSGATLTGTGPWTFGVSGGGTHVVSCSASDLAGNDAAAGDSVKIDSTNPSIDVSHTADGDNGWNTSSPVTETVTASDSGSGLEGAPTCTVDDEAAGLTAGEAGTWTFDVAGGGTHAVSCSVSNLAGASNSADDTMKIDTTDPSVDPSHTADGD